MLQSERARLVSTASVRIFLRKRQAKNFREQETVCLEWALRCSWLEVWPRVLVLKIDTRGRGQYRTKQWRQRKGKCFIFVGNEVHRGGLKAALVEANKWLIVQQSCEKETGLYGAIQNDHECLHIGYMKERKFWFVIIWVPVQGGGGRKPWTGDTSAILTIIAAKMVLKVDYLKYVFFLEDCVYSG